MAKKQKTTNEVTRAQTRNLGAAVAVPEVASIRQAWDAAAVAAALGPRQLAELVQAVRAGADYHDYLALAEEMEERDLYYRSLISTRKLAVQAIEPTVAPASDDQAAVDLAAAVRRDIVDRPEFVAMVYDALDALAKGYSAIEVVWHTRTTPWRPAAYYWRDPRWFRFDRATGRELRLLTDAAPVGVPLEPFKWIVHYPQLKSGLPLRGGLALPAAYYHVLKSYDVSAWIAFVETFGYPLRVGKYSKSATEKDVAILKRAVANIGRDVGAVVPDDMVIDIVTGVQQGSSVDYYQKLADWCDRQNAVGVLGQVATTEGTPGRLGSDDAQNEVRHDIVRSDGRQLAATLQRDLVQPYVDLNHGPQEAYPQLQMVVEPPEDVALLVDSVAKLVPLGMPVAVKDLRRRLRLTEPAEGDQIIQPPAPAPAPGPNSRALLSVLARAGAGGVAGDFDEMLDLIDDEQWEPLLSPIHRAIDTLAAECRSYAEMEERLPELLRRIDSGEMARRLAIATMKARGLGDRDFAE